MYFYYNKIKKTIYEDKTYTFAVIDNDNDIKDYTNKLVHLLPFSVNLLYVKDYDELLKEVNNGANFGIVYENYFKDSVLGLNNYQNSNLHNNRFVCGAYFNFFHFISNVFIKDKVKKTRFTTIDDFKDFKKKFKRNMVIGTDLKDSISFINLYTVLTVYEFKLINFEKYSETDTYDDNVIFYVNYEKNVLNEKMISNKIDALFLFAKHNDKLIKEIDDKIDIEYIDIDFKNTYFDDLFGSYFFRNDNLINIKNVSDLAEKVGYETRMMRNVVIANKNTDENIVYNLVKTIFLYKDKDKNGISEFDTFVPKTVDMIYTDKNIPIHEGSRKYLKESGFIIESKKLLNYLELNDNEKLKCYWRYKKIGLENFKL
tara:strand:- start:560 stop:1672 length:1113 start_codon:yes stop_codon:yes gene_type:complete